VDIRPYLGCDTSLRTETISCARTERNIPFAASVRRVFSVLWCYIRIQESVIVALSCMTKHSLGNECLERLVYFESTQNGMIHLINVSKFLFPLIQWWWVTCLVFHLTIYYTQHLWFSYVLEKFNTHTRVICTNVWIFFNKKWNCLYKSIISVAGFTGSISSPLLSF